MGENLKLTRRKFIKNTGMIAAGVGLAGTSAFASPKKRARNSIPQWKGFNLLDFFNPDPNNARPSTEEDYFRWMSDWRFDFVRIPMAYPYYIDIC